VSTVVTTTTTKFAGATDAAHDEYMGDIVAHDVTDEDGGWTAYDDDVQDAYLLKQGNLVPSSLITNGDVSVVPQPSARRYNIGSVVDAAISESGKLSTGGDDVIEGRARPTTSPTSGKLASRGKVRRSWCVLLRARCYERLSADGDV